MSHWIRTKLLLAGMILTSSVAVAALEKQSVISDVDLSGPFQTRSRWHFTALQGPDVDIYHDTAPGEIQLCLRKDTAENCGSQLTNQFPYDPADNTIHYLNKVEIVRGNSDHPLLWVQTATLPSAGDGDQGVLTQVLAYHRDQDDFARVYQFHTGTNNNQKVRYIEKGSLKGDIISVEPTQNAPFGYWVIVNVPQPDDSYKEVLRYRSATIYGDNNPLAVIDSEMPNIQQRLGLWKAGEPLPLPDSPCPKPRLIRKELWCK